MKSAAHGKGILAQVEVLTVGTHGIWLHVAGVEHFLSYDDFPWFKDANIRQIINVEMPRDGHLHWPELDIDFSIRSLSELDAFPLKSK